MADKLQVKSQKLLNYYSVLGIEQSASKSDITKAYNNLLLKHHPDKFNNRIKKKEYKKKKEKTLIAENDEFYLLIQAAYNRLTQDRKSYDKELNAYENQESSHENLKSKASSFYKTQKTKETKEDRDKFYSEWNALNKQHGIKKDRDQVKRENYAYNADKMQKLLNKRMNERTKQDVNFLPKQISGLGTGANFNSKSFNKLYNKKYGKRNREKELSERTGPTPFNSSSSGLDFTGVSDNTTLYDEEGESSQYGRVDFDRDQEDQRDISEKDLSSGSDDDGYETHNQNRGESYQKEIERKLQERAKDDKKFKNRSLKDFKTEVMFNDNSQPMETLDGFNEDDFVQNQSQLQTYRKMLENHQRNRVEKLAKQTKKQETISESESDSDRVSKRKSKRRSVAKTRYKKKYESSEEEIPKKKNSKTSQYNPNISSDSDDANENAKYNSKFNSRTNSTQMRYNPNVSSDSDNDSNFKQKSRKQYNGAKPKSRTQYNPNISSDDSDNDSNNDKDQAAKRLRKIQTSVQNNGNMAAAPDMRDFQRMNDEMNRNAEKALKSKSNSRWMGENTRKGTKKK